MRAVCKVFKDIIDDDSFWTTCFANVLLGGERSHKEHMFGPLLALELESNEDERLVQVMKWYMVISDNSSGVMVVCLLEFLCQRQWHLHLLLPTLHCSKKSSMVWNS